MGKKDVADRQYTDEFKIEAVRLADSVGSNQAAKRLGIPPSSLGNWVRLKGAGKLGALNRDAVLVRRPVSEIEAENSRLRRELASTKLDLEIVKKAAAYFAKESRRASLSVSHLLPPGTSLRRFSKRRGDCIFMDGRHTEMSLMGHQRTLLNSATN